MIEEELRSLVLMSNLPPSWETYVTTMCNTSGPVVNYSKAKSSILTKDAQRSSFIHDSTKDSFVVWSSADRPNGREISSPWQSNNSWSWRKSRDNQTCNYCKNDGHMKADCRALKATRIIELIKRVVNKRRSTTLAHLLKYWQTTRTSCS